MSQNRVKKQSLRNRPIPDLYFLSFEILELTLFFLCLRHAWRSSTSSLWQFFAGVVYGILLELITIYQTQSYDYGRFTFMVFDVPLVIGIAWANQIYAVRAFSNAINLPEWTRAILDALLVIFIDLIVDPIAIRLGMWDWQYGFQTQYFGIPYANFWGFFWLVFSFSMALRFKARLPGAIRNWFMPICAVLFGLLVLIFANLVMMSWMPPSLRTFSVFAVLITGVTVILVMRPCFYYPADLLSWQFLFFRQGYFLVVGLVSSTIFQPPALLVISIIMLSATFYFYHRSRLIHAVDITS